jgi:hypothetical protein
MRVKINAERALVAPSPCDGALSVANFDQCWRS